MTEPTEEQLAWATEFCGFDLRSCSALPPVSDASPNVFPDESRYFQALKIAVGRGDQISEKLQALVSAQNIALMTAFAVSYVAAQATPAGWVADGVAVAGLLISAIFIGKELSTVIDDIRFFVRLCDDPSGDLNEAGKRLAHAIATVGVDTIIILLTRKGSGGSAHKYTELPPKYVEAVTPAGQVIRLPESVAADPKLQSQAGGQSGGGTGKWTLDPAKIPERDALAIEKGQTQPKGREEAEGIMQALEEGKVQFEGEPRRPKVDAGEPDHDYVMEKDGNITGYVELKTPVSPELRELPKQAVDIGTKILKLKPDAHTQIVVNLKNLADVDKGSFLALLEKQGVDLSTIVTLNAASHP